MEFLKTLVDSGFTTHRYAYLWKPEIVWLPVTLVYFSRKRRNLPFNWMLLMFGAFILSYGARHMMGVWTIWHGAYRLAGIIKLITAGLSVTGAVALAPLIPKALALPSPELLEAANRELAQEVRQRQGAENEISQLNESLERPVIERTTQLEAANKVLQNEIATRRRAEEALATSEARRQAILETALDCIISFNQQGAIIEFNAAAERVFGYPRADVLGKQVAETIHLPFLQERNLAHYLATGEGPIIGKRIEMTAIRANGAKFPVELAITRVDVGGAPTFTAYVRDIADRKRAEEKFRLAVESSPSAMVMVDQKGIIVLVNSQTEKLFGYHRADLIGQTVDILAPHRFRDAHPRHQADFFAHHQARPMQRSRDLYGLRKDGTEFPVEIGLNPIETEEGIWVLSAIVDITEHRQSEEERKRHEAQLLRSQKLESLSVLAGGIAHDFNNLLMSILANATLMLDETAPGSPLTGLIDNIFTVTEQAAQLTRQMLAYSGRGRFAVVPLSISKVVSDIASLLRDSLPATVDLRLNLAPGLPVIEGDFTQIGQLVANLALNGSEAIESTGAVTIAASLREVAAAEPAPNLAGPPLRPGAYVLLEVHDTGIGMDEATLAKMFDPFFSTKFTGRGLGLAAVLGIVRAHHGGISVRSAPQKGTTFQVFLPVEREPARQAPTTDPQALHAKM